MTLFFHLLLSCQSIDFWKSGRIISKHWCRSYYSPKGCVSVDTEIFSLSTKPQDLNLWLLRAIWARVLCSCPPQTWIFPVALQRWTEFPPHRAKSWYHWYFLLAAGTVLHGYYVLFVFGGRQFEVVSFFLCPNLTWVYTASSFIPHWLQELMPHHVSRSQFLTELWKSSTVFCLTEVQTGGGWASPPAVQDL